MYNLEKRKYTVLSSNDKLSQDLDQIASKETQEEIEKEIKLSKEEIENIQTNIEENTTLIQKITQKLEKNIESSKLIKRIFLRLISNSKKLEGITDFQVKINLFYFTSKRTQFLNKRKSSWQKRTLNFKNI